MNEDKKFILEKNLERFDYYIEKADNKASFLLALTGALLVAIAFQSKDVLELVQINYLKNLTRILLFSTSFGLVLSSWNALSVIMPRTPKNTNQSLFYFESIKDINDTDYITLINSIDENRIICDLTGQTKQLAKICSTKMNKVKSSLIGIVFAGLSIVLLIVIVIINI